MAGKIKVYKKMKRLTSYQKRNPEAPIGGMTYVQFSKPRIERFLRGFAEFRHENIIPWMSENMNLPDTLFLREVRFSYRMSNGPREATLQIQGAPRKIERMMGHLEDFFAVEKAEADDIKKNTKTWEQRGWIQYDDITDTEDVDKASSSDANARQETETTSNKEDARTKITEDEEEKYFSDQLQGNLVGELMNSSVYSPITRITPTSEQANEIAELSDDDEEGWDLVWKTTNTVL